MRIISSLSITVMAFLSILGSAASAGVSDVFVSFSDFGSMTPAAMNLNASFDVGTSGSAFVWVRNGFDIDTGAILNALNNNTSVVNFTGATVFNPQILLAELEFGDFRWVDEGNIPTPGGALLAGTATAGSINEFGALTVTGGSGIVSANDGTGPGPAPFFNRDALYDVNSDAFLFARLDFNVVGVGNALLNLEAGNGNGAPIVNGGVIVFPNFGGAQINGTSVIPEPATFGLLLIGSVFVLGRRRR